MVLLIRLGGDADTIDVPKEIVLQKEELRQQWLNLYIIKDKENKAKLIEEHLSTWDENLPLLSF